MADTTFRKIDIADQDALDFKAIDNGDGTYSDAAADPHGDLRNGMTTFTPITASGQVFLGAGVLGDISLAVASTAVVVLYDNNAASGTPLFSLTAPAAGYITLPLKNVRVAVGLYVAISVAAATLNGTYRAVP